jgi:hypothetical protein
VSARPAIGRARWGALGVRGTAKGECVVTRVACANLRMRQYPVTSDAREAREIEGPLRQRGGRAVRLPAARAAAEVGLVRSDFPVSDKAVRVLNACPTHT